MSDWQTAITEAAAALNQAFGESVTVSGSTFLARLDYERVTFDEMETGHQRTYMRAMTVDKAERATDIARGVVVTTPYGAYTVKGITARDRTSTTYDLVRG